MNRSLFHFCIIFASVGGLPAQNQPEKLKMPGADVQNLMLGKWSPQVKYEPTAERITLALTSRVRSGCKATV